MDDKFFDSDEWRVLENCARDVSNMDMFEVAQAIRDLEGMVSELELALNIDPDSQKN